MTNETNSLRPTRELRDLIDANAYEHDDSFRMSHLSLVPAFVGGPGISIAIGSQMTGSGVTVIPADKVDAFVNALRLAAAVSQELWATMPIVDARVAQQLDRAVQATIAAERATKEAERLEQELRQDETNANISTT